jgi:urea transport system ATP-binding protein
VSLNVAECACTVVLGRNGVGKTTLLKCLVGLLPVKGGEIELAGQPLTRTPSHRRVLAGLGYVPQGREIFPQLSVEENLRIGAYAGERNQTAKGKQFSFDDVFHTFPVLKTMRRRIAGNLSGGQQQQLAIARALVMKPRLLVLDEPTEGIQPSIIKDIGRVIELLRARGNIAILLVEQYFDFARGLAQNIAVMDRGNIVLAGARGEIDEEDVRRRLSV